MKCHKCGKTMKPTKGIRFNQYAVDGWKCACGEVYFNPEQAQRILLLNKLKKQRFCLKLSKVRSNLILRIPSEVSTALKLRKGDQVEFRLTDSGKLEISLQG